jgi:hypothetical protein
MNYKNPGKLSYTGKITHYQGGGAFVDFPFSVEEKFGVKGRVPVNARFDGVAYRGSLVNMGTGGHVIGILKEIREKIGKGHGDSIEVEIELDDKPRDVEVPEDLNQALAKHLRANEIFKSLSYSHKREYIQFINEAKKAETRMRRISKTIGMLEQDLKLKS